MYQSSEVCQLDCKREFKGGVLGFFSSEYFHWEAIKDGDVVVDKSSEERIPSGAVQMWEVKRRLHGELLRRLVAAGWEPAGTDRHGMVSVMRKTPMPLPQPRTSPSRSDPAELLRQLASLKDAGIVTQDEFETKKAEILERL